MIKRGENTGLAANGAEIFEMYEVFCRTRTLYSSQLHPSNAKLQVRFCLSVKFATSLLALLGEG